MANKSTALTTVAERSGWKKTGRYEEVERLCHAFEKTFRSQVKCMTFGTSAEGRSMLALVVSQSGILEPKKARTKKSPVVLFQGCIHAGESDGKDAGFLFLRDLLLKNQASLSKVTLIFVPVFNVDGHERVSKNNRPNQRGPEEMGFRTTAQNLNLNRDYIKVDSPEMAAMMKLLNDWDPILYSDFHVSDGADFAHDISLMVQPTAYGPEALAQSGTALKEKLLSVLSTQGHLPLEFYPTLLKEDDPTSGFQAYTSPPRYSNAYWATRNRISILIETHSWKDYAARVRMTFLSMQAMLEEGAAEGKAWMKQAREADAADEKSAGRDIPLLYKASSQTRIIDFQGYAYVREASSLSGQEKITYDPTKREIWKVPYHYELVPQVTVKAPKNGYIVPAAHAAWMAEKLCFHDVHFKIEKTTQKMRVETFRTNTFEFSKQPFEGRTMLTLNGQWSFEKREVRAGSLFVPIAQAHVQLVMHLFEPLGTDSFLNWGFFNAHFEQKEYMENYVAEQIGADMLNQDPELKAEFERRLKEDSLFAKDPKQRLEFFYRRHPSWDERYALYPIFRV